MGILDKLRDIVISPPEWYRDPYIDGYSIEFYRCGYNIHGTIAFADDVWEWSIYAKTSRHGVNYKTEGAEADFEAAKRAADRTIDRTLDRIREDAENRKARFAAIKGTDLRYRPRT